MAAALWGLLLAAPFLAGGCASVNRHPDAIGNPADHDPRQSLADSLRDLSPAIEPAEAESLATRAYQSAQELALEYAPSVKADFAVELSHARRREEAMRATLVGPHRDELRLLINGQPAAQFASEGQKRTLAIALKIAQTEYLAGIHGTPPLLLIDDVMGELDQKRRAGFLPLLERVHQKRGQVFMTCTEENWPKELGLDLHRWEVRAGALRPLVPPI